MANQTEVRSAQSREILLSQTIIFRVVDDFQEQFVQGKFSNPLRAMTECHGKITEELSKNKIPRELFPISMTIGDIDPFSIGGEFEENYLPLLSDFALDPETPGFKNLQQTEKEISIEYKRRGMSLTRYDPLARGTPEIRNIMANEARKTGLPVESAEQVWMGYGAMNIAGRIFRTLGNMYPGREPGLITSAPCFMMLPNAAKDNHFKTQLINVEDLPDQELTGQRLREFLDPKTNKYVNHVVPDVLLITPANNPTGHSMKPENLYEVLTLMNERSPSTVYIFDMAYMLMIPREKAQALTQIMQETNILNKSFFIFSDSKTLAQPGGRCGSAVIFNPDLQQAFQADTIRNFPTYSGPLDIRFQALHKIIPEASYTKFNSLLEQRQKALLETLRDLDPDGKYFANLDEINLSEQDVRLYLFPKITNDWFEIIKKLRIVGAPGSCFGGSNQSMRFSLGAVSTEEILRKSPQTLSRWQEKFSS